MELLGDCDEGVSKLCSLLGWEDDLRHLIHSDREASESPYGGVSQAGANAVDSVDSGDDNALCCGESARAHVAEDKEASEKIILDEIQLKVENLSIANNSTDKV